MADANLQTQVLTFKHRLLPSRSQHRALERILEDQRQLYNAALLERIEAYKRGVSIKLYDQHHGLTECRRDDPGMAECSRLIQRGTLRRLDEAFKGFFSRIKRGDKPGFPRFRGKGWWNSFEIEAFPSGGKITGKRFKIKGLPSIRIHMHRSIPDGKILTAKIKRDATGWYICMSIRCECKDRHKKTSAVGIDIGIASFATLSTGQQISNPRVAKRAERELRIRQRAIARCKKGSKLRGKVRASLARAHRKITNTRATFAHQQSARIARKHNLIVIEKLNLKGMTKSARGDEETPGRNVRQKAGLNRSMLDIAAGRFFGMLCYKAVRAGGEVREAIARYTSQDCSRCGHRSADNRKSQAVFKCVACGHADNADVNAAINILNRGVPVPGELKPGGCAVVAPGKVGL